MATPGFPWWGFPWWGRALLLAFLGLGVLSPRVLWGQEALSGERSCLVVLGPSGERSEFRVLLAMDETARLKGLQYVRELGSDEGMLFDFISPSARPTMWMANTFLALDMVFIKDLGALGQGEIVHIHRGAVPLARAPIRSPLPSRAVFEVNAGEAVSWSVGDRIEHEIFGKAPSCEGF